MRQPDYLSNELVVMIISPSVSEYYLNVPAINNQYFLITETRHADMSDQSLHWLHMLGGLFPPRDHAGIDLN